MGFIINDKISTTVLDLTDATQVNSGTNKTILIQPPLGKIYKILTMYLKAPAIGGSAGTHEINLFHDETTADIYLLGSTQNSTSNIIFNYNYWATVGTGTPSSIRDCNLTMERMLCSYAHPITIQYRNVSDTNQTGSREYVIYCLEKRELI